MAYITKEYLENNIKNYDQYRNLDKEGQANGIATLDANGKLSNNQIPVLPVTQLAVADTNNATSNVAVDSGPVYINTYDVKDGSPSHNNAISIEGKNGISVTANNGGKIEISGHDKPAVLNNATTDGNLVPIPDSTDIANSTNAKNSTAKYLRADGSWYTPENTKVLFTGYRYGLTLQSSPETPNTTTWPVKSLVAGTGMTFKCNSAGALTINGPFYEEGTSDNDKFTFAFEQYKVAYYCGAPIFAFTGDKNGPAFNNSLTAYNSLMNNNGGHVISQEEVADITSSSFMGLTITCPSNVIFAQLDRPIYAPANPGYTMNGSIISTIAGGKQQISIQNSNPAIGFPVDSITASNPGYASLKFATAAHTYNATVKITYESGTYKPDIII